ncbi:MAG TPA: MarR family transcriptional regulator [Bacillota bacterium]
METSLLEKAALLFFRTMITRVIGPGLKELADQQLTQVQLACMRFVYLHPDPSVGEIANGLAISNAAAAKLIDRLVKRAILIREEDQTDRRVLKIKLTPAGRLLLETFIATETQQFEKIIRKMPPEAVNSLQEGLTAFLAAALVTPEEINAICLKCGWDHTFNCPGNLRYYQLTGRNRDQG